MIVYISVNSVEYEHQDIVGVSGDEHQAKVNCLHHRKTQYGEILYDRYYVQEWTAGADEPSRVWTRGSGESVWRQMS